MDQYEELSSKNEQKLSPSVPLAWNPDELPFDLLSRVATLYYLEDKTQGDIARELGLSRQKVQRLLKQARDERIVEIHVHAAPVLHLSIEEKLRELFRLKDVVVAPSHPDESYRRHSVARAAADYLDRNISHGMRVAVGLGRNTRDTANFFQPRTEIKAIFVSAMGGSPDMGASINPNEICRRFASRSGGRAELLYAPAYVESRRVRNLLLEQEAIKSTISMARSADVAAVGVGTVEDDSVLVTAGCQSLSEVRRLHMVGAVGEILGHYFDCDGNPVSSDLDERVISLDSKELARISNVIAIASEPEKALAIYGALQTRVINSLIIDCNLAISVLKLSGVTDFEEHVHRF